MFSANKIVPIIDKSKQLQTGEHVIVDNQDDDMNGKTGTFVCEIINVYGEHVYMILLDEKKHYSTYPQFVKRMKP